MSYNNCSLPPGFEVINAEAMPKNLGVPDETNADVGIIDEEDPFEEFFNSANISYDTQMEMTQQQTASALPENPAVNNALNNAAQPETPTTSSVPKQMLGISTSNDPSNAPQQEAPMTHSVTQMTGVNTNVSSITAEPEPPMTHSSTQQIRVTTGESKVAQEIIVLPLPRNNNPQQVIPVVYVAGLVSSSTRPPATASSAGSSNEGQVKNTRKRRLYEQSTQSTTDKAEEARIKKAKYSHDYRTMKNLKLKELENNLKELENKLEELQEKCSRLEKERDAARHERDAAIQENSRLTQELEGWNQCLRETVQQYQQEYNQENNG